MSDTTSLGESPSHDDMSAEYASTADPLLRDDSPPRMVVVPVWDTGRPSSARSRPSSRGSGRHRARSGSPLRRDSRGSSPTRLGTPVSPSAISGRSTATPDFSHSPRTPTRSGDEPSAWGDGTSSSSDEEVYHFTRPDDADNVARETGPETTDRPHSRGTSPRRDSKMKQHTRSTTSTIKRKPAIPCVRVKRKSKEPKWLRNFRLRLPPELEAALAKPAPPMIRDVRADDRSIIEVNGIGDKITFAIKREQRIIASYNQQLTKLKDEMMRRHKIAKSHGNAYRKLLNTRKLEVARMEKRNHGLRASLGEERASNTEKKLKVDEQRRANLKLRAQLQMVNETLTKGLQEKETLAYRISVASNNINLLADEMGEIEWETRQLERHINRKVIAITQHENEMTHKRIVIEGEEEDTEDRDSVVSVGSARRRVQALHDARLERAKADKEEEKQIQTLMKQLETGETGEAIESASDKEWLQALQRTQLEKAKAQRKDLEEDLIAIKHTLYDGEKDVLDLDADEIVMAYRQSQERLFRAYAILSSKLEEIEQCEDRIAEANKELAEINKSGELHGRISKFKQALITLNEKISAEHKEREAARQRLVELANSMRTLFYVCGCEPSGLEAIHALTSQGDAIQVDSDGASSTAESVGSNSGEDALSALHIQRRFQGRGSSRKMNRKLRTRAPSMAVTKRDTNSLLEKYETSRKRGEFADLVDSVRLASKAEEARHKGPIVDAPKVMRRRASAGDAEALIRRARVINRVKLVQGHLHELRKGRTAKHRDMQAKIDAERSDMTPRTLSATDEDMTEYDEGVDRREKNLEDAVKRLVSLGTQHRIRRGLKETIAEDQDFESARAGIKADLTHARDGGGTTAEVAAGIRKAAIKLVEEPSSPSDRAVRAMQHVMARIRGKGKFKAAPEPVKVVVPVESDTDDVSIARLDEHESSRSSLDSKDSQQSKDGIGDTKDAHGRIEPLARAGTPQFTVPKDGSATSTPIRANASPSRPQGTPAGDPLNATPSGGSPAQPSPTRPVSPDTRRFNKLSKAATGKASIFRRPTAAQMAIPHMQAGRRHSVTGGIPPPSLVKKAKKREPTMSEVLKTPGERFIIDVDEKNIVQVLAAVEARVVEILVAYMEVLTRDGKLGAFRTAAMRSKAASQRERGVRTLPKEEVPSMMVQKIRKRKPAPAKKNIESLLESPTQPVVVKTPLGNMAVTPRRNKDRSESSASTPAAALSLKGSVDYDALSESRSRPHSRRSSFESSAIPGTPALSVSIAAAGADIDSDATLSSSDGVTESSISDDGPPTARAKKNAAARRKARQSVTEEVVIPTIVDIDALRASKAARVAQRLRKHAKKQDSERGQFKPSSYHRSRRPMSPVLSSPEANESRSKRGTRVRSFRKRAGGRRKKVVTGHMNTLKKALKILKPED